MRIFTRRFWTSAGRRALHTLAQTAIGTIGTTALLEGIDWAIVASATGVATILSLLKSIAAGTPEGGRGMLTRGGSDG